MFDRSDKRIPLSSNEHDMGQETVGSSARSCGITMEAALITIDRSYQGWLVVRHRSSYEKTLEVALTPFDRRDQRLPLLVYALEMG